jgi:hypothetical protein
MNMRLVVFFLFALLIISCSDNRELKTVKITSDLIQNPATASGKKMNGNMPIIQFDKTEHDFGIILQGEKVSYTFKYKNIGNSDLIINNAKASCGCTVPHFSREPIAPGQSGEIEVVFDSGNRSGRQTKNITVWSNCQPNQTILKIFTEIVTDIPNK